MPEYNYPSLREARYQIQSQSCNRVYLYRLTLSNLISAAGNSVPGTETSWFLQETSRGRPGVLQRSPTTTFFLLLGNSITRGRTQLVFLSRTGERLARSISERGGNRIEKWVSRHAGTILSGVESSRRTEEDTHEPLNAVVVRPRENLALADECIFCCQSEFTPRKKILASTGRVVTTVFYQKDTRVPDERM